MELPAAREAAKKVRAQLPFANGPGRVAETGGPERTTPRGCKPKSTSWREPLAPIPQMGLSEEKVWILLLELTLLLAYYFYSIG